MPQETLSNQDLALLLFSAERAGASDAEEIQEAGRRTFEKLDQHLSRRVGSAGYHTLFRRAVKLAAADSPWLASVHITENGGLEGFDPIPEARTADETAEGFVAILAGLIGLLDTFIGRTLCLRVLQNVWPDAVQVDSETQEDSNG